MIMSELSLRTNTVLTSEGLPYIILTLADITGAEG